MTGTLTATTDTTVSRLARSCAGRCRTRVSCHSRRLVSCPVLRSLSRLSRSVSRWCLGRHILYHVDRYVGRVPIGLVILVGFLVCAFVGIPVGGPVVSRPVS